MKAVVVENKSQLGSVEVRLKIPTDRLSILELHKHLLMFYKNIRYTVCNSATRFSPGLVFTPEHKVSLEQRILSHSCYLVLKKEYILNYSEHDNTPEYTTRLVTCNGIPVLDYLDFRTIDNTSCFNIVVTGQYSGVLGAITFISTLTELNRDELGLSDIYIKDAPTDGEPTEQDIVSRRVINSNNIRYDVVVDKNGWICNPDAVDSSGCAKWVSLKTNEQFVINYTEKDGIRKSINDLRVYTYYKCYNNGPEDRFGYRRTLDRDRGSEIISKFLQRYNIKHLSELTFK